MSRPSKRDVKALAYILHRCPDKYEGPCWGPTDADMAAARDALLLNEPGRGPFDALDVPAPTPEEAPK